MDDFRNANPLAFLLILVIGGVLIFNKWLTAAFSGRSYRQRRSLAKARAAKRRKRRRMRGPVRRPVVRRIIRRRKRKRSKK